MTDEYVPLEPLRMPWQGQELAYWNQYHRHLLAITRELIDQNHHGPALVTAHIACEIFTERVFSVLFDARKIRDLKEAIADFMSGHNLGADRVRDLYVALSGDQITEQGFWPRFKASRKLRGQFVHTERAVTKEEAEEACRVVDEFLTHLERIAKAAAEGGQP